VNKFTDLPLSPRLQAALAELGFTTPTEIQAKVIPTLIAEKRDVHAQAQTGTGKTFAFGLPLLDSIDTSIKNTQALIIAPTRELVLQIYEALKDVSRQTGIIIEPVYGGMSITRQIDSIRRGAHIIVGTPGRLNDHLRRKTLSLKDLKTFILDEADIMLEMGFKEEIDEILKMAPKDRQIWLFSATMGSGIDQLIKSHMHDVFSVRATKKNEASKQVKQYFCVAPRGKKASVLVRFIEASPEFYGIIFCQTKLLTNEITEQLASKGLRASCLHGDMQQNLRNQVIKGFKNKDFSILLATDVAARGIDVSDLTHVINYSIPDEFDSYIHRIGRTGRAGKEGIAITLVTQSEKHRIKRLEKATGAILQEIAVPEFDSIVKIKMSAASDFIEQSKTPDQKFSPVHKTIKELIDSFTEEEIKNAFAIALEEKYFKDIVSEDLSAVSPKADDMVEEICIDLGYDDDMSEDIVRSYLYNTCKLLPQEINKVRVINKKTFISVSDNKFQEVLDLLRKTPISEMRHRAFVVQDFKRDSSGQAGRTRMRRVGERRDSGRSDSRSRGGERRSSSNRGGGWDRDRSRRDSSDERRGSSGRSRKY